DPRQTDDMAAAHRLQDGILVEQQRTGTFEAPDWDSASREAVRQELIGRSRQLRVDESRMFGAKGDVEPLAYLIAAAAGLGGLPPSAAIYQSGAVARNDGKTIHRLTVSHVPVDGFWSITVYNRAGFFEKNDLGAYSTNNLTAVPNTDGSTSIHFGGRNRDI